MDCLATVKRHMGEDLPEIPVHAKKQTYSNYSNGQKQK